MAILPIDRSKPLDSQALIDATGYFDEDFFECFPEAIFEWSVDEEDERSLALSELDLTKVILEPTLESDDFAEGQEVLKRLKDKGYVRLDVKILKSLWENRHLIPETWKGRTDSGNNCIYFYGTILRDRVSGSRWVFFLKWVGSSSDSGFWDMDCRNLNYDFESNDLGAVLAS
jgi:hypothetical protein